MTNRVLFLSLAFLLASTDLLAQGALPMAEQNALIQRHCTVCHSDAARNGGLSLEGFSVDRAPSSLIAMLLSKMTQGLSVATLMSSHSDNDARTLIIRQMRGGAMTAAGVPPPADATTYVLIDALIARMRSPHDWSIENTATAGRKLVVTASILREAARPEEGQTAMYRLIATCDTDRREGELRLSWSPVPKAGTLLVAVDGGTPIPYRVEGMEKMGNGLPGEALPASVVLLAGAQRPIPFPSAKLAISGLLGDVVEFTFGNLTGQARQQLSSCFG